MSIPVFGQSSVAVSGLGECVLLKVDALLPSVALSLSVSGNGASRATDGRDGWTGRLKFLPYHHSHESHRALSGILSHTRQSLIYRVLTRHS